MANRSYLYSMSADRKTVRGLSECNYMIPLAFKILVSQNAKICPSLIWKEEGQIAVQGAFKAGREKLFAFLDDLSELNIFDKDNLKEETAKTKEFLCNKERELDFVILECGEIFWMDESGQSLEEQNRQLFEYSVLNIDREIETCMIELRQKLSRLRVVRAGLYLPETLTPEAITNLEAEEGVLYNDMWMLLGIDGWDDVLYYHFK